MCIKWDLLIFGHSMPLWVKDDDKKICWFIKSCSILSEFEHNINSWLSSIDFVSLGYTKSTASRKQSDEKGKCYGSVHHNNILYDVRLLWLCCIWEQCPREPAYGFWILWAILAGWCGQRLHCGAPSWGISGQKISLNFRVY